jgi:FlgN protein
MEQVESLCTVLGDEARLCDALAELLRVEQVAVVGLDGGRILACLEERQAIEDELGRIAEERRALVRGLAADLGSGGPSGSATALLPLLPPDPQARLRGAVRRLRGSLLTVRSLGRQNALLIGGSLDGVGELLRALRALVPGVRYDAGAQVAAPLAPEQLDRRA